MTPQDFVTKWAAIHTNEISVARTHFMDVCDLVGHPRPLRTPRHPHRAKSRRPRRLRLASDLADEQILERLLALNLERAAEQE